jgi:diacylglycerol kinase (ATP)
MNGIANFLVGRLKSIKYAAKGAWLLITTEHSIIVQLVISTIITVLGFVLDINTTEWVFQIFAIGLILVAEASNTAIEYLCDFIHPEYHKKIGFIKDIAAGIPFIAAVIAIIIGLIIYLPKFVI